jgi:YbbR domain-containing protein
MEWKQIFIENYKVKLALFVMAVFLWFFVVSSREYVQVMKVPLRVVNLPDEKLFLEEPPSTVQVRFRGKGTSLILLYIFGDVHLSLDLLNVKYSFDYPLRIDQVEWATGLDVQILDIVYPDTVKIRLDDKLERKLAVKPLLLVIPAEGYIQFGDPAVEPDSVKAIGAKSELEKMEYALTQARTVEGATNSFNIKLPLSAQSLRTVRFDPAVVNLTVNIEKTAEREISALPVRVKGNYSFPIRVQPPEVSIRVRGAASLLNRLTEQDIPVNVEISRATPDSAALIPIVNLPRGVTLLEMKPPAVQVLFNGRRI